MRIIALLALLPLVTWAQECVRETPALACPTNGVKILDERYPVQGFVVSALNARVFGWQFPLDLSAAIFKAYRQEPARMPPLYVLGFRESMEGFERQLTQRLAADGLRLPRPFSSKVVFVQAPPHKWQQDYQQASFDPTSGRPVMRKISAENWAVGSTEALARAAESCGLTAGVPIEGALTDLRGGGSGVKGGNIEAAPGGFCLVGDILAEDSALSACGAKENILRVPVSWLKVGHADEIIKFVPTRKNDGRPATCEFAALSASPAQALASLKANPAQPLLAVSELQKFIDTGGGETVSRQLLCESARQRARRLRLPEASACGAADLSGIENRDLVAALEARPSLLAANQNLETLLQRMRTDLRAQILERLPECRRHYKDVPVPGLFLGSDFNSAAPTDAVSAFPNPTNSVTANASLIFPHPQLSSFRQNLQNAAHELGLEYQEVETWDYLHEQGGNVHCGSNSFAACKPAGR